MEPVYPEWYDQLRHESRVDALYATAYGHLITFYEDFQRTGDPHRLADRFRALQRIVAVRTGEILSAITATLPVADPERTPELS